MQPLQSYPVFEADQVLSNGHLNNLLNYLEQQERLTRIKLLGRGIGCGLEINATKDAISISKGCGLTSQGYLIHLCDTNFTHYIDYAPPVLPNDLYFLTLCGEEKRDKIPYYGQKDILELLPEDDKENEGKKPLTALKLEEYTVILFLEAAQTDLKNCDTQDCNDKGSRMDFVQRTLLIKKKLIPTAKKTSFNTILLQRFNVPASEIKTSEDILQGFLKITDDTTLTHLAENLTLSWDRFAVLLGLPEENPLKNLSLITLKKKLSGNTEQRIYVQYFYDFIDDLVKAYLEFRSKIREIFGECFPDEMGFPLHLSLGLANENTLLGKRNIGRHYFESSPIQNGQAKIAEEAADLLERMVVMVNGFIGEKLTINDPIIITPNTLGMDPLSSRAIPYYYNWNALNPYWNFGRRYNGNEKYNLGYRAAQQTDAPLPVKNPLHYDIERYNAFRIEGHIGKNYQTALTEIIKKKNEFNLPIEVLALNAVDLTAMLNGKEIKCHVEDLTSYYRVMITGIVCQLQENIAYVANLKPKRAEEPVKKLDTPAKKKDSGVSGNMQKMQKMINYNKSKNKPISFSNGDIIRNLAPPKMEEGVVLSDFIMVDFSSFIIDQKIFFDYVIKQPELLLIFLQQLAEIVKYLLSSELSQFDEEAYNKLWTPYSKTVTSLIKEVANSQEEEIKQYFKASNTELLFKCASEKLFALKEEYLKRIEQYDAAVNFNEYFKKHPGMEHKAGVPKGGTFILVYNGMIEALTKINMPMEEVETMFTLADFAPKESRTKITDFNETKNIYGSKESKEGMKVGRRNEYEEAYELIEKLNLGDASKNVMDALNARNKEIRQRASSIASGTVIADFYLPYLCCSDCPPIAYILPEEKEIENKGPLANAGPDQTLPFGESSTITLDGSASSDEDGMIKEYIWTQVSGPSSNVEKIDDAKIVVKFKSAGVYVFALKVTDDRGSSAEDTVTINVTEEENYPPIADASEDQVIFLRNANTPGTVTLDGSKSSDPENGPLSYTWTFEGGTMTPFIVAPGLVKTDVSGLLEGEYKFGLKVTDNTGNASVDSVNVQVKVKPIEDDIVTKSCGSLAEISNAFKIFERTNQTDFFKRFSELFDQYGEVRKFFDGMESISKAEFSIQLGFFTKNIGNKSLMAGFSSWLEALQKIILESKDLKLPALQLYHILSQVATHIVCIQKEDFDVAKIEMQKPFELMDSQFKTWREMLEVGAFKTADAQLISRMKVDFEEAFEQTRNNGEQRTKPQYLRQLKSIIETL